MKFVGYISLFVCAASLCACNQTTGPYASASGRPSANPFFVPSGYQTVTDPRGYTCGPDVNVCHYERRDRLARGQQ